MYNVSNEYKACMDAKLRNRAYMIASVGIVNQEAQAQAVIDTTSVAVWSDCKTVLANRVVKHHYATLEEDYWVADGSFLIMPQSGEYTQYEKNVGICTSDAYSNQTITINLPAKFDLRGLTFDLGKYRASSAGSYTIVAGGKTKTVTPNESGVIIINDTFTDVQKITITTQTLLHQRLHIDSILLGIGVAFTNDDIQKANHTERINAISEELPETTFKLSVLDVDKRFNVDSDESIVNYLEPGQSVQYSLGITLDNGTIEYVPMGKLYLQDWSSSEGLFNLVAQDRISLFDMPYPTPNKVETRTLYTEAVRVLTAAGLEPDEYILDNCLKDVSIQNPMPECSCAEALQLIANAGRCILYQDRNGMVVLKANFALVLSPEDMEITATPSADWSNPSTILTANVMQEYAEFAKDFVKLDNGQLFIPTETDLNNDVAYVTNTGYVSKYLSKADGTFDDDPTITITLPGGYIYYGFAIEFGGNRPKQMHVETFYNDVPVQTFDFDIVDDQMYVSRAFDIFNKFVISFPKAEPYNRVIVKRFEFGDLTDYKLSFDNMLNDVRGSRENRVKTIKIKEFEFVNDEEGKAVDTENYKYYNQSVETSGKVVTLENQLISTNAHAQEVGEWLKSYYINNVSYDVKYRGEPRLNAADIIFMESRVTSDLQVEIEELTLDYNGAFSGTLDLRRALKLTGGTNEESYRWKNV